MVDIGGTDTDVIVVGAGLAGLAAAIDLQAAGFDVQLFERADRPGGRVATDFVDGFRLDRGFQILNTAYPQVRRRLDLDALDVRPLTAGALVRQDGRLRPIGNPLRQPSSIASTLSAHLLSLSELLHLGGYSARVSGPMRSLPTEEITAAEAFDQAHLGGAVMTRFLKPFLTGVLLESELQTSRRYVDLVWRTFVRGQSVLPAAGMGAIALQLAGQLIPGTLRLSTEVTRVDPTSVIAADSTVTARAVLIAADPVVAAGWLSIEPPVMHSVTTYYHSPSESPLDQPTIVLDGSGTSRVINSVVLTEAVAEYAPRGRTLVSSSILGGPVDEAQVRREIGLLYGVDSSDWPLVGVVEVKEATPSFAPGSPIAADPRVGGFYVAGDRRATPSLQGALASGTAVARRLIRDLTP
ncbi:MAG: Flavin containing amine oxidoreductase [Pseudonocardiales bacterium]|nr:Flavin containing amine oxidoreductase [Pseudonocardiales bacterium]